MATSAYMFEWKTMGDTTTALAIVRGPGGPAGIAEGTICTRPVLSRSGPRPRHHLPIAQVARAPPRECITVLITLLIVLHSKLWFT
ncbi:hypothetical protein PC118_g22675 [Phytophthora cactorum]|uniref:Uncharacterized protein n=1 Tax=Phytophthora cactorum TaxID=29920 RepID=A0A8T1AMB5_9STRA|nr:hypothetical protein PC111_g22466 [Phytophthora cactorum]KAG2797868.1 hypothetical protein PC112_g21591 [Phytophthora cactorum]KAG2877011.1 hypothetical protein PC114_g23889 [Phytophthora cactorum]KAG2884644.1 hypothetical protein PC115_g21283 [Phytophthora cactorum]KAG2893719.1 hypothetical protein PC117_g23704 [Phytophthora cactorum]